MSDVLPDAGAGTIPDTVVVAPRAPNARQVVGNAGVRPSGTMGMGGLTGDAPAGMGGGSRGLQLASDGNSSDDLAARFVENHAAQAQANASRRLEEMAQWANDSAAPGAGVPQATAPGATDRATTMGSIVDGAMSGLRTAGDMATQALISAPLGAARELFRAVDDIANWATGQQAPADGQATFAGNPARAVADLIPQGPNPAGTAGRITRDVAQFLVGFVGGQRVVRGIAGAARGTRAVAPATVAGRAAEGMTAGAIADFFASDANRQRLADLWVEAGFAPNALTDFLESEEDDSQAEARLKNAMEGGLVGTAVEGLIVAARGFRAGYRAMRNSPAREANAAAAAQAAAEATAKNDADMLAAINQRLGDAGADAPVVARRPAPAVDLGVPDAVAARGVAEAAAEGAPRTVENTAAIRSATDPGPVFINFARISTPEDVQRAMGEMADAFRGQINEAGRGVQTNDDTRALAARLGMTPEQLLARERGEAWNAETIHAAREMLNASTERTLELARAAAAPNASPADGYAFRRMLATHAAIQAEVLGARREAGRALQAWSMAAGGNREMVAAIDAMMTNSGGMETAQALAQRLITSAAQEGGDAAVAALARTGWGASTMSMVREAWVNGLLSNPATHLANITSNFATMGSSVVERAFAARFGSTVEEGEASAMMGTMIRSVADAFMLAARSFRDEPGDVGRLLTTAERPMTNAISAQARGVDPESVWGRTINAIGNVVNAPSKSIQAEDVFFQTLNFRASLDAAALRTARQEVRMAGQIPESSLQFDAAVAARRAELRDAPTEAMRIEAADDALYHTLNRATWGTAQGGGTGAPGQVSRGLQQLRDRLEVVRWLMPFIRTPMNAFSYGMERTPLAPLVGQWRADIAAGGVRADLAMARMSVGTSVMLVAFDLADRGMITGSGPDDAGERDNWERLGIQPYSIRIGNSWVQYNRLDPAAFLFSLAANMAEMGRRRETELAEVDQPGEIMAAGILAVVQPLFGRTAMLGVGSLLEAISRPEMGGAGFMNQFAGSFVPGVVAGVERAMDPAGSQVMNPMDAILARIPGLSDSLPPRRNLWGEVSIPESAVVRMANAFGPARISPERGGPADVEMERLNLNVTRLNTAQDFGSALGGGSAPISLSAFPAVYDRLVVLAGNEWKNPATGLGLRDTINEMVQGRGDLGATYRLLSDGAEGGKAQMIRATVEQFRQAARMAVLDEPQFWDFRQFVIQRREDEMARTNPRQ